MSLIISTCREDINILPAPLSHIDRRIKKMISDDILSYPVISPIRIGNMCVYGIKHSLVNIKNQKIPGAYIIIFADCKKSFVGYSVNIDARIKDTLSKLKKGKFPNQQLQSVYNNNNNEKIEIIIYPTIYRAAALEIRAILRESLSDVVGLVNFGRECNSPKKFDSFTDRW